LTIGFQDLQVLDDRLLARLRLLSQARQGWYTHGRDQDGKTPKRIEGVREFETLKSTVFGRARLLPSRALMPRNRLSRSFALPIPGHPQKTR